MEHNNVSLLSLVFRLYLSSMASYKLCSLECRSAVCADVFMVEVSIFSFVVNVVVRNMYRTVRYCGLLIGGVAM
jgi:hypothetical protein